MKHLHLILLFFLLAPACGRANVDPAYEALVAQQHTAPPLGELGPGDKIELTVFNEPALSGPFTVSSEGTISYPNLGRLEVDGKTCSQLEDEITTGLANGYLNNPSVRCTIAEYNSRRVYIFGEVKQPGSFPYRSNITIVEAMALAGGFAESADTNRTKLSRVINGTEIQVQVPVQEIVEGRSQNIKLLPGDIIFVPTLPY